jgi:hypothetical protein
MKIAGTDAGIAGDIYASIAKKRIGNFVHFAELIIHGRANNNFTPTPYLILDYIPLRTYFCKTFIGYHLVSLARLHSSIQLLIFSLPRFIFGRQFCVFKILC